MPSIKEIAEAKKKLNLRHDRDKDRQLITGRFRFHECPGGVCKFVFHKYKEDPVENYEFTDGETYRIPLGVARHLNNECKIPVYENTMQVGKNQKPFRIKTTRDRVSFESLEFSDIKDFSSAGANIVTAEKV